MGLRRLPGPPPQPGARRRAGPRSSRSTRPAGRHADDGARRRPRSARDRGGRARRARSTGRWRHDRGGGDCRTPGRLCRLHGRADQAPARRHAASAGTRDPPRRSFGREPSPTSARSVAIDALSQRLCRSPRRPGPAARRAGRAGPEPIARSPPRRSRRAAWPAAVAAALVIGLGGGFLAAGSGAPPNPSDAAVALTEVSRASSTLLAAPDAARIVLADSAGAARGSIVLRRRRPHGRGRGRPS